MTVLNWQKHCPMALGSLTEGQLALAIGIVMDLGTCFCVDMDSRTIHTTERGAAALLARRDEIEALR